MNRSCVTKILLHLSFDVGRIDLIEIKFLIFLVDFVSSVISFSILASTKPIKKS